MVSSGTSSWRKAASMHIPARHGLRRYADDKKGHAALLTHPQPPYKGRYLINLTPNPSPLRREGSSTGLEGSLNPYLVLGSSHSLKNLPLKHPTPPRIQGGAQSRHLWQKFLEGIKQEGTF